MYITLLSWYKSNIINYIHFFMFYQLYKNGHHITIYSHSIEMKPKYRCHVVKFAARVFSSFQGCKIAPLLAPPPSPV